jgi:transposase
MDLTETQWRLIEPLLEVPPQGRGRPWRAAREVVNGIMWVMRTGAPWADLPDRYPPYQTCHRRFQAWCKQGSFQAALRTLAQDLEQRGGIDMSECYIDGTFAPAKKGAMALVRRSGAKGPRSWQLQTALVFLSPSAQRALRRTK